MTSPRQYVALETEEDHAAIRDHPERRCRKLAWHLMALAVLLSVFVLPTVAFLIQPVYNEFCMAAEQHHEAIPAQDRRLKRHGHLDEIDHNDDEGSQKHRIHEHAKKAQGSNLCHLQAQSRQTLLCGALLLVFLKVCSLEPWSLLLPQLAGSTEAAQRDMPFGILFRFVAMWSFWGVMFALFMTIWKYQIHFADRSFVAVHGGDQYFLVLDRGDDTLLSLSGLTDESCAGFRDFSELRKFGFLAFGVFESLAFLAGAFFFGLGELFKIDIAKGYLFQRFLTLEFVGYYTTSLVGDKLISGFDRLIGQFKGFTKKYAGDIDRLQQELTNMEDLSLESLAGPASIFEKYAKRAILGRLKPIMEPKLEKAGLSWDDVVPILEELDTPEEIQEAAANPIQFIQDKASVSESVAKKLALAQLRPKVEPKLKDYDFEWSEFMLVLEEMDSFDELQEASSDLPKFLEKLAEKLAPVARRLAMKALKPNLAPKLKEQGVEWDDVKDDIKATLESLDTVEEIKAAAADLPAFIKELAEPIARKLALNALKPKLEPKLKALGLSWEDALLFLSEIDTLEEIQQAVADPEQFLVSLKTSAGIVARKCAMAQLQKVFEPTLKKQNLEWADVQTVLEEIDTVEELQSAIADPDSFLESLADKSKTIALKWTLAQVRVKIAPKLKEGGVPWEDAVSILRKVDTVEELQTAVADPIAFLKQFIPEQRDKAVAKGAVETETSVNRKEQQKVIWPAVLQASAAALWISVAYIHISPCVSYDPGTATSLLFGLYDLHDGVQFISVLAITHFAMICTMVVSLLLQGLFGKMGWVRAEKALIVLQVLALMAYTVFLSTYQSPKNKEVQAVATTTTGAPALGKNDGVLESSRSMASSAVAAVSAVPIGMVVICGYAAEAVVRTAAAALSRPSSAEVTSYQKYRAKVVQAKAAETALLAPLRLKTQARQMQARIKVAVKGLAQKQTQAEMWEEALVSQDGSPLVSIINKLVAEEDSRKKAEAEAKRKTDEAKRKADEEAKRKAAEKRKAEEAAKQKTAQAAALTKKKEDAKNELAAVLKETIQFADHKATTIGNADAVLKKVATVLNKYTDLDISCEGHTGCNCRGACGAVKLSEERANACKDKLKSMGVKNNIQCIGKGCQDKIGKAVKMYPH